MKKELIKILVLVLIVFCPTYVNALGISASSTTITNGGSVRITVNASGLTGKFSVTSSNSNVLVGGTGSEWIENESKSYTFNSKGLGTATITVNALDVSDSNGNTWSGSKSITIKVVKPREKSNNNNLKSLSVEGFEIIPAFNRDTLEYTLEVGDEVESIKINANMEDGYGHVDGAGEHELAEGINKFEIKGISETGLEKVYNLTVTVKDNNPINKEFDGNTYSLVKRASSLSLPEGINKELFTESKVTIDGVEIPAYISEELKYGFVGLKDDKGTVYLFKYVDGKIDKKYELLNSIGMNIEFMDAKDIPDDYSKTVININDKDYTVYQNENKDYALIYGKNLESGNEGWYLYNIKEKSIQSYNDKEISKLKEDIKNEKAKSQILMIAIAGFSLIFLIIITIEIIFNRKMKKELRKISNNINNNTSNTTAIVVDNLDEVLEDISDLPVKEEKTKDKKKKEKKEKKSKNKKDDTTIVEDIENVEIAEKVEIPVEDKKKAKTKKKKDEKNLKKDDEIPTIEEIAEDLKPIDDSNKELSEEEEALREMEEFYGKVKKSKRHRL